MAQRRRWRKLWSCPSCSLSSSPANAPPGEAFSFTVYASGLAEPTFYHLHSLNYHYHYLRYTVYLFFNVYFPYVCVLRIKFIKNWSNQISLRELVSRSSRRLWRQRPTAPHFSRFHLLISSQSGSVKVKSTFFFSEFIFRKFVWKDFL